MGSDRIQALFENNNKKSESTEERSKQIKEVNIMQLLK
jgi:hypothetical protein